MFGAWDLCGDEPEWFEGFPYLMRLYGKLFLLFRQVQQCVKEDFQN